MTTKTLPDYPDLMTLDQEKLDEIQESCRTKGHLDADEKLLDRITQDLTYLKSIGLTKKDIWNNHQNMHLKFNNLDEYDVYLKPNKILESFKLPKDFGKG